jgi:hypothetical protein
MKTRKTTSERLPASAGYAVGLPDTQGGMCWLAGYESDPTRYYTPSCALIFKTQGHAVAAIARARKTHPGREREYCVIPVAEMARHNDADQATASGGR